MRAFRALTKAQWFGFWRDHMNVFWVFLLPLVFLLIFGFIFRDGGQEKFKIATSSPVPIIEQMPGQARTSFNEIFKVKQFATADAAIERVRNGDEDAYIEMRGTTVVLQYSQTDQAKAATIQSAVNEMVQNANVILSGTRPIMNLETSRVEDKSLKTIQFIAPGLLGWAIGMGAMFGAAMSLVEWRRTQLLRRLRLSPASTKTIVGSRTVVSIAAALAQTAVFIGVGVIVFGMKLTGSWWMVIPLVVCGTLAFMAIGLLVGSISKTVEGASGLANVIITPMAFLSGSFIPLDAVPKWIQTVSQALPLRHLNEGMLDVMVRNQGPEAALMPITILLGFTVVFIVIANRFFQWET